MSSVKRNKKLLMKTVEHKLGEAFSGRIRDGINICFAFGCLRHRIDLGLDFQQKLVVGVRQCSKRCDLS